MASHTFNRCYALGLKFYSIKAKMEKYNFIALGEISWKCTQSQN